MDAKPEYYGQKEAKFMDAARPTCQTLVAAQER